MADFTFNVALGRVAHYAGLPASDDALVLVLLQASGLDADDTLRDYDTLSAILAANDECDFTGYARRTLSGTTVTVDDTGNEVTVDSDDPASYTNSGGSAQQAGKAIICYDPDTTGGTDADLIPLVAFDAAVTFDPDVETSLAFDAAGWWSAADAS